MKAPWTRSPQQLLVLHHHATRQPFPASHRIAALHTPRTQKRTFITPPFSTSPPTQTLTASRTLPYPSQAIYAIIADVNSYSAFLPFCESSTVTKWSRPDGEGQRWPSEAELVVGWKGVSEAFQSRIYCVPGKIVEAVGGSTQTTLPRDEIAHHTTGDAVASTSDGGSVLSHLLTRWTVRQASQNAGQTDVNLALEYRFSNPLYSVMSGAVADKVAGYMIEAFEERVRQLLREGASGSASGVAPSTSATSTRR